MSVNELDTLKNHSKVDWVEQSSMYNNIVLEQRKYDEEFDKHTDINRFNYDCRNLRTASSSILAQHLILLSGVFTDINLVQIILVQERL